jgi:hypothetical protein
LFSSVQLALREDGLKLVKHRYDAGEVSELDLQQATNSLASAKSDQGVLVLVSRDVLSEIVCKGPFCAGTLPEGDDWHRLSRRGALASCTEYVLHRGGKSRARPAPIQSSVGVAVAV